MIQRIGAVLMLALAVSACTTQGGAPVGPVGPAYRPPPPPPPPPPAASIIGHGAYRTHTGAHGDCSGLSVALMHDTASFHRRVVALYGSADTARLAVATVKARSAKLGPAQENPLAESVQCDASGVFTFRDVAPGSYFIIARVKVSLPQGASEDLVIMRHLDLAEGETRDVSLAP